MLREKATFYSSNESQTTKIRKNACMKKKLFSDPFSLSGIHLVQCGLSPQLEIRPPTWTPKWEV